MTTREFADVVRRQYGSQNPGVVTGEYRFGEPRHIFSDTSTFRGSGGNPPDPADSVAAYAEWLEGTPGLKGILDDAMEKMRTLGVVRQSGVR